MMLRNLVLSCLPVFLTPFMTCAVHAGLISFNPDARLQWHDDFEDNDVTDFSKGAVFHTDTLPDDTVVRRMESGGFYVSSDNFTGNELVRWNNRDVGEQPNWSFVARMTIHGGVMVAVGTSRRDHAAILPENRALRGGSAGDNSQVRSLPNLIGEEILVRMNLFDGDLEASAWLLEDGVPVFLDTVSHSVTVARSRPGLGVGYSDTVETSVTFHEIWVSDSPIEVVPEPPAVALTVFGLFLLAALSQRRRAGC